MQICPTCQNDDMEQTTMGIMGGPDTNKCRCLKCGWTGQVWETQTACNKCEINTTCEFRFDPYNYDTVPGIDCLAAK